jgi:hypothetical protein
LIWAIGLSARPRTGSRKLWATMWGTEMQIGMAAYLRNVAIRCNRLARKCTDVDVANKMRDLSEELTDKAEQIEKVFEILESKK